MPRPTRWDEETLFNSGDDYFASLLTAIGSATKAVELETYIFEKGILADRLTRAFIAAADRGVRVRVIVDGWGSPGFATDYWPALKAAGVRVRFFRVSPWILRRFPGDPQSLWQRFRQRWTQANRGNHRKFCIVDGRDLWVGSYNVSDVHLHEVSGDEAWKDAGLRVRGVEVQHAVRTFQRAFLGWRAISLPRRSPRLLLLNDSIFHIRRARIEQIRRMRLAHERIWLATPYFVPVGSVFRLLTRQAKRGLDVRLIVPRKNDLWFVKWMSLPLLNSLQRNGVKVYVYTPRFSHQKLFISDDWLCMGSTNINHRSFLHDLEMDVVITHPEHKKAILEDYVKDQELSTPFDSSEWEGLPWWKRWVTSIFLLARYWA